jgi:hypothetical protein
VELAVPPTTSGEAFETLCVALYGAIVNFYADAEDQEDPIRITSHEMSPMSRSEGLRAQIFDCEKLCVMTPIEPSTP